jgi:hypothetical protein
MISRSGVYANAQQSGNTAPVLAQRTAEVDHVFCGSRHTGARAAHGPSARDAIVRHGRARMTLSVAAPAARCWRQAAGPGGTALTHRPITETLDTDHPRHLQNARRRAVLPAEVLNTHRTGAEHQLPKFSETDGLTLAHEQPPGAAAAGVTRPTDLIRTYTWAMPT